MDCHLFSINRYYFENKILCYIITLNIPPPVEWINRVNCKFSSIYAKINPKTKENQLKLSFFIVETQTFPFRIEIWFQYIFFCVFNEQVSEPVHCVCTLHLLSVAGLDSHWIDFFFFFGVIVINSGSDRMCLMVW